MRKLFAFLLFALFFPLQVFAGLGDVDSRYYVTDEMWAKEPYKNYVLLEHVVVGLTDEPQRLGVCSAQYISPNLILSAGHCIVSMDEFFKVLTTVIDDK